MPVPGFVLVNSSTVNTSFNTHINYHVIDIKGKNVSARVQISPNSLEIGYIVCLKYDDFPDIFQYPPDCNVTRIFCPFDLRVDFESTVSFLRLNFYFLFYC